MKELTSYDPHNARKRVAYLSGPMRGKPDNNAENFSRVALTWREKGYEIINPVEMDRLEERQQIGNMKVVYDQRHYARRDLLAIIERADCIVALVGWQYSVGARAEIMLAVWIGLEVYDELGRAIENRLGDYPSKIVCLTI